MIQFQAGGYARNCDANSGGVSRVWVADSADFDFTSIAGSFNYTAVALIAPATLIGGSGFFPINFNYLEGQLKTGQSVKSSSNVYKNSLELFIPVFGKEASVFQSKMQQASACGSLLFIIELYNGDVMVMGESSVNTIAIPIFRVIMDGAESDSGKAMDDANGVKLMFKGDYTRPLAEFTGGIAAIIALQGV